MPSFYDSLLTFSQTSQSLCQSWVHSSSSFSFVSEAFLCGIPTRDSSFLQDLQKLGLIHLIVVSGTHLILLSEVLDYLFHNRLTERRPSFRIFIFLFLFAYVLMTGLQAPTVRAFFSILLKEFSSYFRLSASSCLIALLSGVLCLLLFPTWVCSLSLILSWLAALGLSVATSRKKKTLRSRFIQHLITTFLVQILTLPLMSGWSYLAFLGNFILNPILSILLWPLCLLTSFREALPHWMATVTETVWMQLSTGISHIIEISNFDSISLQQNLNIGTVWIFLLSIQFLQIHSSIRTYRGRHA